MTDEEYAEGRAIVLRSAEIKDEVLDEAVRRGEAFILDAWYYHTRYDLPFLTLAEAVDRAQDDCAPNKIIGPDGTVYDPYTGEPMPTEAP